MFAQDIHVNESSYVVKVDASTVGYGNQSEFMHVVQVKWTAEVRERVVTTLRITVE